jgi:hypothetical protein
MGAFSSDEYAVPDAYYCTSAANPVRNSSGDKDEFLLRRTRGLMPRVRRRVRRAKVF